MNKRLLATLTALLFTGAIFALSSTVLSDDDDSSDDDDFRGLRFFAVMTGAQEVPPNTSQGTGRVEVRFDPGFTRASVRLEVRNLQSTATRAHFHCALPGANGPIAFGLFDPGDCLFDGRRTRCTLTNQDFTGADCTPNVGRPVSNVAALALAMRDGLIYANVHTPTFPGGEVRGQMLEN